MFPTYCILTLLVSLGFVMCLVQISDEDNLSTDFIIKDAINKLFTSLKLNNIKTINSESRLNQYSTLKKYFMSVTLQDYNERNDVKRISKVENLDNNTIHFVYTLNEVLNEGNVINSSSNPLSEDDSRIFIEQFIHEQEYLKGEYNSNSVQININTDVLKHLRNLEPLNGTNNLPNISFEGNDTALYEDEQFWEPSGRRVYRGKQTKIKHFPFMASIQIFNSFHCAGSIISSDLIITACSCLQLVWNNRFYRENPAFLSVRIGSSFYRGGGEVISVLEVYFHPGYTPKTLKDNVCLLRLIRHIKFRRKQHTVKKIDFDRNPTNLPITTEKITIVGWGATTQSGIIGHPWKHRISYAELNVYPFEECQDVYSRKYVTRKNFCAGFMSKGGGACNKDAGGPGISNGKLVGIISFGPIVCGSPDKPTVFTKIGYYSDWIEEIMEQEVPVEKRRTTLKPNLNIFMPQETIRNIEPITPETTLQIEPITPEDVNQPIQEADSLRIINKIKDEYKDILQTTEEEIEETQNEINNGAQFVTAMLTDLEETAIPMTKLNDFENDEPTETTKKINMIINTTEEEPDGERTLNEKEILKIIDDIDLEEIIQQEVIGNDSETILNTNPMFYLSDKELSIKEEENGVDVNVLEGMDEVEKKIEDMTRQSKTNNILSERELKYIISEVLREEIQNKPLKLLGFFYLISLVLAINFGLNSFLFSFCRCPKSQY